MFMIHRIIYKYCIQLLKLFVKLKQLHKHSENTLGCCMIHLVYLILKPLPALKNQSLTLFTLKNENKENV